MNPVGVAAVDWLLLDARSRLVRLGPHEAAAAMARGALLVDIRPLELRCRDGEIPDAVVVDRNVLEWRCDPSCESRLPLVSHREVVVIVMCD